MPEKVVQRKLRIFVATKVEIDKPIPEVAFTEHIVDVHDSTELFSYINREDVVRIFMFWDRVLGDVSPPMLLKGSSKDVRFVLHEEVEVMELRYEMMSKEELVKQIEDLKKIYEQRISMLKAALAQIGPLGDEALRKQMMAQVMLRDVAWAEALHKASGSTVVIQLGHGPLKDNVRVFAEQFVTEMQKQLTEGKKE